MADALRSNMDAADYKHVVVLFPEVHLRRLRSQARRTRRAVIGVVPDCATMQKTDKRGSCMKVFLIVAGLALACFGCRGRSQRNAYVARITAERVAKDAAFKTQSEPIPMNLRDQLLPLVYYPPDPRYDVLAVLTPSSDAKALQMVYSDGAIRDVRRVGTLEFILNGERFHLAGFVEIAALDANDMFVPFGDLTNSTETYHGGRILDVRRTTNDLYFLDFNQAFNPSCYYRPTYSCPVPPKENRLPIAVRAGEKIRVQPLKAPSYFSNPASRR